jgi:hypothetical protein
MLSAGVLPALEQLFRQLPVVSPAHVTAVLFLVSELLGAAAASKPEHAASKLPSTFTKA